MHADEDKFILLQSGDDDFPSHWPYTRSAGFAMYENVDGEGYAVSRDTFEFLWVYGVSEIERLLIILCRSHIHHFVIQTICEDLGRVF